LHLLFLNRAVPERAPQSEGTLVFGVLRENGGQLRRNGKHYALSCAHSARSLTIGCVAVTVGIALSRKPGSWTTQKVTGQQSITTATVERPVDHHRLGRERLAVVANETGSFFASNCGAPASWRSARDVADLPRTPAGSCSTVAEQVYVIDGMSRIIGSMR
jgi:hypothetical protein